MATLTGRAEEKEILLNALASPASEMVAVLGRRRVGKTFLINALLIHSHAAILYLSESIVFLEIPTSIIL